MMQSTTDWPRRATSNVFAAIAIFALGTPLPVNAAPAEADEQHAAELQQAVEMLATLKPDQLGRAAAIIRGRPKQSWAIIDSIARSVQRKYDSRISSAMYLVLSQADSEKLIEHWNINKPVEQSIDGPLLMEIANRLGATPKQVKPLPIDRELALGVFIEAISTNRARLEGLKNLGRLPNLEIGDELFSAVVLCLDDEAVHEKVFCCGISTESIRQLATAVLSQHVINHENELTQLLLDDHDHRRVCAIQAAAGNAQVFTRHGDRILAMVSDKSLKVRLAAVQRLPLLAGREGELVTTLTDSTSENSKSKDIHVSPWFVARSLHQLFPRCGAKDQNRIAEWFATELLADEVDESHARHYAFLMRDVLPKIDQPLLDSILERLLGNLDGENPLPWSLRLLSVAGPRAAKAAPTLRGVLKTAVDSSKPNVAAALHRIANDAEEVIPVYRAALESNDKTTNRAAVRAAKELGTKAAPLVPQLISRLDDSPGNYIYILFLRDIGPPAAAAIPRLESLKETASKSSLKRLESALRAIRAIPDETPSG